MTGAAQKGEACPAWIASDSLSDHGTSDQGASAAIMEDLFWGLQPSMSRILRDQDAPTSHAIGNGKRKLSKGSASRGKASGKHGKFRRFDESLNESVTVVPLAYWPKAFRVRQTTVVDTSVAPEVQTIDPYAVDGFQCATCRWGR